MFGAIASSLSGASSPPPDSHTWKPMAEWFAADNIAAKLAPHTVEHSELRFRMGDDIRWAAADWDDTQWEIIGRDQLPLQAGIFWVRLRVRTLGSDERVPSLVLLGDGKAHELYCDGAWVRSSGVPANSAAEEVGAMAQAQFELPPRATTPGEHVFAFRMSSYRRGRVGAPFTHLWFSTVPPGKFHALDSKLNMLPAMGVGAMLTLAIAGFVLWVLADRRLILLLVAALCLSAALLVAVATAPKIWNYPASWIYFQSLARIVLVVAVGSLLAGVTFVHFLPRHWRWLFFLLGIEAFLAWHYAMLGRPSLFLLWRVSLAATLLIAGAAAWRRREGAWWVMAGALATALLFERDPRHFDRTGFVLGFLPVLVGLIAAIALQIRRERLLARDARLTAARLEIELLRKSLQPHFLLNTLTTLCQVLEEKPAAAVHLIEDLATEFRSLTRLSIEKQVPLAEELALCRAHLRVMSARTERAWSLETENISPGANVPPALFLTLIENGFSHQRVRKGSTTFRLSAERARDAVRYIFFSPGAIAVEASRISGGTGLRYVRSRLEESFPGAWELSQRETADGWETLIKLGSNATGAMG